ncbi:MAG: acetyl-CoA carboxylase carboxyltransferase subunit alpha [Puniceicoccales bacterium]|jgi:acetyl-CoA carboxylase carboxyl transferase subunit alpha|nr:acetyl-CoA carboxylase carboxyltransferase subunit alpha [Puniceicoccales bacterium]
MFGRKPKKPNQKFLLEFESQLSDIQDKIDSLVEQSKTSKRDLSQEIGELETELSRLATTVYSNLTIWQKIQIARHPNRPYALDFINGIFSNFQEFHGDRLFGDDKAIVGGPAFFDHQPVMVIGTQKGRTLNENILRNFGCPYPEGYRKALRLMKMAEKFSMPIVTLIDTPGAYPGIGSEERHVAEAIAVNLRDMSALTVPIVSVVIGEGGSGGALGIAVADKVLVLENAYYSVISPEGCAAILWKDRQFANEAAEALQLQASKLVEFGVADEVIAEPFGGAHQDPEQAILNTKNALTNHLSLVCNLSIKNRIAKRYERFRNLGIFSE